MGEAPLYLMASCSTANPDSGMKSTYVRAGTMNLLAGKLEGSFRSRSPDLQAVLWDGQSDLLQSVLQ
jgi:hypothetical protein